MDPNSLINIPLTPEQIAGTLTWEKIAILVALIGFIVSRLKKIPFVLKHKDWLPIVDFLLGIGLCCATQITYPIYSGILIGLVIAGGYASIKSCRKMLTRNSVCLIR